MSERGTGRAPFPRKVLRSLLLATLFGLSLLTGCADDAENVGRTSAQAFTVEGGDKFVVSATSDRVVLEKRVGDVDFPFSKEKLLGKAILIHPVDGRAEDGVYARATSIDETPERLDVSATPLTLAEMATIAEDDIVRIYIPKAAAAVEPQALHVLTATSS